MAENVVLPLSALMLDLGNPRVADPPSSQPEAALRLLEGRENNILGLAAHIVEHGLDPIAPIGVIEAKGSTYRVLEGNRRVLALQAMESPDLLTPGLTSSQQTRLMRLSSQFVTKPIAEIPCVLFASEAEANEWINLRHTGLNKGAGLMGWGSVEQERWKERHSGKPSPHAQVLDFVRGAGLLSEEAQKSRQGVITTVERLVKTRDVRHEVGLSIEDGILHSWYPLEVTAKVLTAIVEDLLLKRKKVGDLYTAEQRLDYVRKLPPAVRPDPVMRLERAYPLGDLPPSAANPKKGRRAPKPPTPRKRSTLARPEAEIDVSKYRARAVLDELKTLDVSTYPNAAAVLLRVFIELSVKHAIDTFDLEVSTGLKLNGRIDKVVSHLAKIGAIDERMRKAMMTMSGSSTYLSASSTVTMNQYVHNEHVFPAPADLRHAWDQFEALLVAIWPAGGYAAGAVTNHSD